MKICDRCKKVGSDGFQSIEFHGIVYDLCLECKIKFWDFIKDFIKNIADKEEQ